MLGNEGARLAARHNAEIFEAVDRRRTPGDAIFEPPMIDAISKTK
jgi:hypothetical protein